MKKVLIIPLIALITFVGFTSYYYRGVYTPTEVRPHETADISMESYYTGEILTPVLRGEGRVVFDMAHDNDFSPDEINPLLSKLSKMGVAFDFLEDDSLSDKLKYADVFVVISPRKSYTTDENNQINTYLEKKGRLVLISDPAREDSINSLSANLGIVFKNDYLYNMEAHGGNFRYVFLDEFSPTPVTEDLDRVIFYVSSSISSDKGVAFAKEGTRSSVEGDDRYAAISMSGDNVLAISDLTFMTEPYNRASDNEKLILNIAIFMLKSERTHSLDDYPHILDSPLDIVYSNKSLLEEAISAKTTFSDLGMDVEISDLDRRKDMLYLGYFEEFEESDRGLEGVYLTNETFEVTGVGTFGKKDTVLIHLSTKSFRQAVTVLSLEEAPIQNVVDILKNGEIESYMLSDNIAIYMYEPIEDEITVEEEDASVEETNGVEEIITEEETVEEPPVENGVEVLEEPTKTLASKSTHIPFKNEC